VAVYCLRIPSGTHIVISVNNSLWYHTLHS